MPLPDDQLEALARARFSGLTQAEISLLRAASTGNVAFCGPNNNLQDPANDPAKANEWSKDRQIRADLIRWLCVNRQARELVDPKGIQAFGAKLSGALDLSHVTVPFGLNLWRCRLTSETNLRSIQIAQLDFQGSWTQTILADGAKVRDSVFFRVGFYAAGEVVLTGAEIGGTLGCNGGTFDNHPIIGISSSGRALTVDRAVVKGGVFLTDGFSAKGEVRFSGAQVGGNFECTGGAFENPARAQLPASGIALNASGLVVNGSVFLRWRFHATGEVQLIGAQIGGALDCANGSFENPPVGGTNWSGRALTADRAVIKGSIFLRDSFTAKGDVRLTAAQVAGDLTCNNVTFTGTLYVDKASIKGTLHWMRIDAAKVWLDLNDASVDALIDEERSWPAPGNLSLDGFVYRRFSSGAPIDPATRLKWLALQEHFTPQPYHQLAKVLMEEGDEDGANQVLVEMERLRRKKEGEWLTSPLLRWTFGYGYRPLWAFWWLCGLSGVGWIVYRRALLAGTMTPTEEEAYKEFKAQGAAPQDYGRFFPSIYSLENSLPLVKLGQGDRWQPDPDPNPPPACGEKWVARLSHFISSPKFLRWFLWAQILLGWIFATLFAAGVTGVIHK